MRGASCCGGSDKGGSRGLELIKCNDAMWGDLAACVLIKNPPLSPAGGEEEVEEEERQIAKKERERECHRARGKKNIKEGIESNCR